MDNKEARLAHLKAQLERMPKCDHKEVEWKAAIKTLDKYVLKGLCKNCHQTVYCLSDKPPKGAVVKGK